MACEQVNKNMVTLRSVSALEAIVTVKMLQLLVELGHQPGKKPLFFPFKVTLTVEQVTSE